MANERPNDGRVRFQGVVSLVVFGFFTVLTLLVAVPVQLLLAPVDPDRAAAAWVTRWTWGVAHFFAQPFWRVRITGRSPERATRGERRRGGLARA